jgi:hypothetical protein
VQVFEGGAKNLSDRTRILTPQIPRFTFSATKNKSWQTAERLEIAAGQVGQTVEFAATRQSSNP